MRCFPEQLSQGDTLTIEMAVPHGKELGIKAPDGTFYYVFYTRRGNTHNAHEPIASNAIFSQIASIGLPADTFIARLWDARAAGYTRVFKEPGRYTIYTGDVLETDADHSIASCSIHYRTTPG